MYASPAVVLHAVSSGGVWEMWKVRVCGRCGRCGSEGVREVQRILINKGVVLFWVKHLQQGCCWVAMDTTALE